MERLVSVSNYMYKSSVKDIHVTRGAEQGGLGWSQPPLNSGWGGGGLNTCQPPLILRKKFLGGVGSP